MNGTIKTALTITAIVAFVAAAIWADSVMKQQRAKELIVCDKYTMEICASSTNPECFRKTHSACMRSRTRGF